jgi:uncharacterized protein YndB with AHSA1/START domain
MRFENAVVIDRPAREVFAFLADLENVPRWNYAIESTSKTSDGPVRVGTTYRQVRTLPSRSEESLEVTELEPDRRLAVRGDLGPFAGTLTYVLEETDGRTRLVNTADLEARGVMRLAAPLAAGRVREAVAANLGELKRLLESRA